MPSSNDRKTTLYLPESLSRRVKIRAAQEGSSFNALVLEGLELRLAQKKGWKRDSKKKGARE